MKFENKYSFWEFTKDILYAIKPYKLQFSLAVFLRASSDTMNLYPAIAISIITNFLVGYINNTNTDNYILYRAFILLIIAVVYYSICHNLSKLVGYKVAERTSADLYKRGINHILKLDMNWQEKENSGNKLKKVSHGAEGIQKVLRIFLV